MHDHDDPKKCKLCSGLLDGLAELEQLCAALPDDSIANVVQSHCEAEA